MPRFGEGDLTEFTLEAGAAGMDAMVVMDGVSDVLVRLPSAALAVVHTLPCLRRI